MKGFRRYRGSVISRGRQTIVHVRQGRVATLAYLRPGADVFDGESWMAGLISVAERDAQRIELAIAQRRDAIDEERRLGCN